MGIEGHWLGSYFQELVKGRKESGPNDPKTTFRIEAWFELDGNDLKGRMIDLAPTREWPLAEWLKGNLTSMTWLQRWRARSFLARNPDCIVGMRLSENSTLEGRIDGRKVAFTKTYSGPTEHISIFGGKEHVVRQENPPIEYAGELSADGTSIRGVYKLKSMPHQPQDPRAVRTFELHCEAT